MGVALLVIQASARQGVSRNLGVLPGHYMNNIAEFKIDHTLLRGRASVVACFGIFSMLVKGGIQQLHQQV